TMLWPRHVRFVSRVAASLPVVQHSQPRRGRAARGRATACRGNQAIPSRDAKIGARMPASPAAIIAP
ncbi:hypothetical protein B1F72_25400, partial [Pseudomonas syringae]|uniref:hypothetical protein n=1 Tax=Pseudomonas syringae TaxID=317 RepID=UPI001027972B